MYRKIEKILRKWKTEEKRKPLLITGARQTGKTYIMKKFGGEAFDAVIAVDFEKNPHAKNIFSRDLDPKSVIPQLELISGIRFIIGKTLIIFDEIQECPRAITALKYY